MSSFLYFIEGTDKAVGRDVLPALGIAHAFDAVASMSHCVVTSGPNRMAGSIIAASKFMGTERVGYYPDRQTWRRMPGREAGAPAVFIGFYTDARPTPADLLRKEPLQGHEVELADGNRWLVPIARGLRDDGETLRPFIALPCAFDLDDAGQWTAGTVEARYAPLWDAARRWVDATTLMSKPPSEDDTTADEAPERQGLPMADALNIATLALVANYRVHRTEIAMLGLLNQHNIARVLNALIDLPTFASWAAKNVGSAGSNTDAGPADDTQAIAPASPTSSN